MGEFFGVVAFVLILGGLCVALIMQGCENDKTNARLMAQCMNDHKEYECVAMLRKPQSQVVPIAIPVYVGK